MHFLIACSLLGGCATKVGKELYVNETPHSFHLHKSFPFKKSWLPSGEYRCYYYDSEGKYYEGPATLNEDMMFSRGNTGGIYIYDGYPLRAHIYVQDKHPSYSYAEGIGVLVVGGKGYYMVHDELPNSVTSFIHIKKEDFSENQ